VAKVFPLTQMLEGARKIMLDGAGLGEVWPQLLSMACMSGLFLGLGSFGFKWKNE
jgi:hypothetical protein